MKYDADRMNVTFFSNRSRVINFWASKLLRPQPRKNNFDTKIEPINGQGIKDG